MESQPFTIPLRTPSSMPALGQEFANFIGFSIGDKACLMGKNSSAIVAAQMAAQNTIKSDPVLLNAFLCWSPIVDGIVVTEQPFTALVSGNYDHSIPVAMGTTRQEAVLFIYQAITKPLPAFGYDATLAVILGVEKGLKAVAKYPVSSGTPDTRPTLSQCATDYIFICANRNVTRSMASHSEGANNVFLYDYNHLASFSAGNWGSSTQCYTAICHGADLPFVFNSFELMVNYTSDEAVLGAQMVSYWTNFAHTGNPSQSGPWNTFPNLQPFIWPAYTVSGGVSISFETPSCVAQPFFLKDYCDFWDVEGYGL